MTPNERAEIFRRRMIPHRPVDIAREVGVSILAVRSFLARQKAAGVEFPVIATGAAKKGGTDRDEIVLSNYRAGMKYADIARICGVPFGTVASIVHAAANRGDVRLRSAR